MEFEEKYMDVLQNIEFAIMSFYRAHSDLSDYDVLRVLEALENQYNAENIGRKPRSFALSDREQNLLEHVKAMCEWRLGRKSMGDTAQALGVCEPKTLDEIVQCLKRIIKSAKRWNKEGGRQGYLNFIVQFVK